MKKLIYISILAAVLLAACGPQATPTMSAADVQATAFSAANTMVAQTQAAIPTATSVPPTNTPEPTLAPTNTQAITPMALSPQPTIAPTKAASDPNSCNRALNMGEAGPTHPILIQNESGGNINISLNLVAPNDFGQCGALSYSIAKGGQTLVQLPSGNWWAYAWITLKGGGGSTASGSFYVQPAMFERQRLIVGKEVIVMKP